MCVKRYFLGASIARHLGNPSPSVFYSSPRRTLEEGFASSSSVAPNSPIRASGPSDRFGCRRVDCSPASIARVP
ncbi:hypothetical protein MUK42_08195 [Musa troglodytarum]|uniref:Uncharacterized protein n=1 Tax=Musa troglodytarum TaxID=320322 RepID=A0A9E7EFQ8_9LILI|nr:hypothetical protein MUK42_08195 [Musa troglodytarum]